MAKFYNGSSMRSSVQQQHGANSLQLFKGTKIQDTYGTCKQTEQLNEELKTKKCVKTVM